MEEQIEIEVLTDSEDNLPTYSTKHAAGADVKAANKEPIVIEAGASALIPTGLHVAIPEGYEIQVRPRSGLALKNQLTVLNTPGTIDADYRGEIGIILINHGKNSFTVTPGMRIAQLVVAQALQARFILCDGKLTSTCRGAGGFGHTGT